MRLFVRWISYSFLALLAIAIFSFIAVFSLLHYFGRGLPDHNSLANYKPNVSSIIYLDDGSLLKEFSLEKRHFMPIDKIPTKLKQAFLSAEDKNFYEHMGVDPTGVVRSFLNNLMQMGSGKRPQGASTITQQVARIFLVGSSEVSYVRKIKEAILAFRVESTFSKDKILELYLNQIYLGCGTYGVSAASRCYFGKSLDELTIAECALLAGLAKGATFYNPAKHVERATERRNWVLKRMRDDGSIQDKEYEDAVASKVSLIEKDTSFSADYYAEEIRKDILAKLPVESVNKEGLVIRTPLNPKLQDAARHALRRGLENLDRPFGWRGALANIEYNKNNLDAVVREIKVITEAIAEDDLEGAVVCKMNPVSVMNKHKEIFQLDKQDINWTNSSQHKLKIGDVVLLRKSTDQKSIRLVQVPIIQGAIIAMNQHNGNVLAMQGGYCFENSKFNRATQAYRQTGSVFKPFVYLTALNAGYSPASIIDGSGLSISLGKGMGVWEPRNYKNKTVGNVTLRYGLEKSLNTVTVKLATEIGLENVAVTSEKFEIFDRCPRYWSLVLGAVETTLIKMVNAYCMVANGGKKVSPILIEQVQNSDGLTIYRSDSRDTAAIDSMPYDSISPPVPTDDKMQIFDEKSIYQFINLLVGVVQQGTSARAKVLNIPLAGKTGTTNDSKEAWFVGFTPNIVVGVVVYVDDHSQSLGDKAVGANTALPIFIDFMQTAGLDKDKIPFKVPPGITFKYIDRHTGRKCSPTHPDAMLEAFKERDKVSEVIVPIHEEYSNSNDSEDQQSQPISNLTELGSNSKNSSENTWNLLY